MKYPFLAAQSKIVSSKQVIVIFSLYVNKYMLKKGTPDSPGVTGGITVVTSTIGDPNEKNIQSTW